MKPKAERLVLETYPFQVRVDPRFGDMDVMSHLNNVAIARIYEEGRLRFTATFRHIPSTDPNGHMVLAEVLIRYLAEGQYPDPITVGVGVLHVGRSAYKIGAALFQDGRCIGISDVVAVWVAHGRPAPFPDDIRAALEAARIESPVPTPADAPLILRSQTHA